MKVHWIKVISCDFYHFLYYDQDQSLLIDILPKSNFFTLKVQTFIFSLYTALYITPIDILESEQNHGLF